LAKAPASVSAKSMDWRANRAAPYGSKGETSAGTEVEIYVPRALGATNPEPPQAEEDMLEATVRRRGTEWVTDLVRCATCRRFAGGLWFRELEFPRKRNHRHPIGVGSGPGQILSNLPRMS
jgi:hypothetical protein